MRLCVANRESRLTDKTGKPCGSTNSTTKWGTQRRVQEFWNVRVGTPTHHRIDQCRRLNAEQRSLRFTLPYVVILESRSARLACLRSVHWSVGKSSRETAPPPCAVFELDSCDSTVSHEVDCVT